jgi:hypothetical protein
MGRKPAHWTAVDRDYEQLRMGMQTLFGHLGITVHASVATSRINNNLSIEGVKLLATQGGIAGNGQSRELP